MQNDVWFVFQGKEAKRNESMARARSNVVKTLATVAFFFIFCWTWNQTYYLMFYNGTWSYTLPDVLPGLPVHRLHERFLQLHRYHGVPQLLCEPSYLQHQIWTGINSTSHTCSMIATVRYLLLYLLPDTIASAACVLEKSS